MRKITLLTLIIFTGFLNAEGLWAAENKKALPPPPVKTVEVKQQTPDVKSQAPTPMTPVVPIPETTYNYNPTGKPDPFRPFVEEELAVKKKAEKQTVSSIFPLQKVEADQFKLVGVGGDQNRRVAVVVESVTKKHYPLFIGTHIGLHNGKVVEILPDRVIIEEGKTKKAKRIILKLHKN